MAKRVKMTINSEAKKARADLERQEMFRKLLYCSNQESLPGHGEFMSDGLIMMCSPCQFMRKIIFYLPLIFFYFFSDTGEFDDKSTADSKKRRKNKVHEIKEESQITNDFAQHLDLSCMSKGLVKAPSINNGFIAKYNR